ncbi:hypothetical protein SG34_009000 [Thalassomonas viridans]|uniref:Uncharacterized protein n=1 Tax=Thalassomonas viridans TaxID=137584 RepID=A0AAF0CBZ8_9GAMM|nr:hypothetical protein [Thalassomonas viridans]WDE07004.1 hypothetical protein SG34_009000 [Thalassomonas viridans]
MTITTHYPRGKLRRGLTGLVLTNLMFAHSAFAESAMSFEALASSLPGSEYDTAILGQAYNSTKQLMYPLKSISGVESREKGNTQATIYVGMDLGYSEVLNLLDGAVDGSYNVPAIQVSAGANYAKQTAADEFTSVYTMHVSVKPKKKVLLADPDVGISPTQAALDWLANDPANIGDRVGDEYVSAIEYGANLMVNMVVEYASKEDKRNIGGYLDVSWAGKVSAKGQLQLLDEEVKQSVKITITAKQSGGDPTQLANILPDGIASCSLKSPEFCFDIFTQAVEYLNSNFPNQFATLENYNVERIHTQRYDESGSNARELIPQAGYQEFSLLMRMKKRDLYDDYVTSILHHRRARSLLQNYASRLTPQQEDYIEQISEYSLDNASVYEMTLALCQSKPFADECQNSIDNIGQYLKAYDEDYLNLGVI